MKYSDPTRLFQHLEIEGQHRQIIFNSGADDDFFVNMTLGAMPIDQAITTYLLDDEKKKKYDFVLVLDRQAGSTILRPLADQKKDMTSSLARGRQSVDKKRGNRPVINLDGDGTPSASAPPTAAPTREPTEAEKKAVEELRNVSGSDELQLLGRINRILKEQTSAHFAIVYMYPDTMLLSSNNVQDHIDKLRLISEWAHLTNCDSFLILDEHRQAEFNKLLDWVWNNDDYSRMIDLPRPGRDEIAAFLKRAVCRHGLFCSDVPTIATTAAAEGSSLRNFMVRLKNFVAESPENLILDHFYSDKSKVRSLEVVRAEFESLTGLKEVKDYVHALCKSKEDNDRLVQEKGMQRARPLPLPHFMFLGNPGTGKTTVARLLGQLFLNLGLRTRNAFVEIAFADLVSNSSLSPVEVMMNKVKEAMGGVLFVDEVYLLAEDQGGRMALQALMKEMEDKRDSFTVIMAGYEEKLPELYKVNPGFESRIGKKITFKDYSTEELTQMVCNMLRERGFSKISKEVQTRIEAYIDSRQQRGGLGNGRGARTLSEKIEQTVRNDDAERRELRNGDIPIPMCLHAENAQELIRSFEENFSGMPRVKKFMRDLYKKQLAFENWRKAYEREVAAGNAPKKVLKPEMNNCYFLGNPGTGKTTVAREMGKLFYHLGLISEDKQLKEVDPIRDFTSSYVGEYAQKVKDVFDEALGGVLFIDEAYQLARDEQGRKVLDQIVKMVTEPRYMDMIIIMAGYPDEMQQLAQCNPGLKRRFPNQVYFDDFSNSELVDIFMRQVKDKGMKVRQGEEASFNAHLRSIFARMATERHFGNAGAVINFFSFVFGNQAERLTRDPGADRLELLTEDLVEQSAAARDLDVIMEELNRKFVGLEAVKRHIVSISNRIRVGKLRASRLSVPASAGSNHLCFVGNMGTGKKSMAAYMAEIFCSLKIVAHPKLRVWRGIDLKGSYVGQTKDKVNKMFEDSADSVILIDEIYALTPEVAGNGDSFGLEAVDAIAGGLSDPQNATTVVILSGVREKLEKFLLSNPQLGAFFGQTIEFPDYTNEECLEILKRKLQEEKYEIPEKQKKEFDKIILAQIAGIRKSSGRNFGNAFAVNGLWARIMEARDVRFGEMMDRKENITDDMLRFIDVKKDLQQTEERQ